MDSTSPRSDLTRSVIAAAKGGDADAYDELFVAASHRLRLFLRIRLGIKLRAREDSMDLVQETYLAAHKAFPSFENRDARSFVRWLCRIAENCIRERADYHGAAKRADLPAERITRVMDRVEASTMGPATRAGREEQRSHLRESIVALPEQERAAILLRHFQGLGIAEISLRLGTSQTSTRRILGRAIRHLAVDLRESRTQRGRDRSA